MAESRFLEHLQRLIAAGQGNVLTIEGPAEEVVQVVDMGVPSSLTVQIGYYPTSQEPSGSLADAGVEIPESWTLTEWEEEAFATFAAPRQCPEDIAAFLQQVFARFYSLDSAEALRQTLEKL